MLDNILNLIKSTVSNEVAQNSNIPEEKKIQTVEATTQAVGEGLKQNLNLGNMGNLVNLFKGSSSVSQSNPIVNNITSSVVSQLVQKVGLSQGIANTIASAIVPTVMKVISGKVNDPNEKGFSVESLIETFSGKKNDSSSNGVEEGIMGTIGKLFS